MHLLSVEGGHPSPVPPPDASRHPLDLHSGWPMGTGGWLQLALTGARKARGKGSPGHVPPTQACATTESSQLPARPPARPSHPHDADVVHAEKPLVVLLGAVDVLAQLICSPCVVAPGGVHPLQSQAPALGGGGE